MKNKLETTQNNIIEKGLFNSIELKIGTVLDGKCEIKREIARGGMGIVYEAYHIFFEKKVAVKIILSIKGSLQLQRFQKEVEAYVKLSHPNIIHIYDAGIYENMPYIVMEYIDGVDICQYVAQHDKNYGKEKLYKTGLGIKRDWKLCARLIYDVALGLEYMHQQKMLHRDIKPSNIMVRSDGTPIMIDLGLVKFQQEQDFTLTKSGEMLGTLQYMPIEQGQGKHGEIDARSDIYSLGLVLYELLTEEIAYPGTTLMEICYKIMSYYPPLPREINPQIPEALEKITIHATEKQKEKRYATAQEFADALKKYLDDENEQETKKYNDLKKQVQLQRNKKRIVTCCIALILVIIATISIITNYQKNKNRNEYKINTINEYKELMKDIERKKCKLSEFGNERNELEKQKNNLTQEKNNLTRNKEMLQSDIKKKLSNLESERDSKLRTLDNRRNELEKQKNNLTKDIETLQSKIKELSNNKENLQKQCQDLEDSSNNVKETANKYKKNKERLEREIKSIKKDKEKDNKEKDRLESQLSNMQSKRYELNDEIKSIQDEMYKSKIEIPGRTPITYIPEYYRWKREYDRKQRELANIEKQIKDKTSKIERTSQKIKSSEKNMTNKLEKLKTLERLRNDAENFDAIQKDIEKKEKDIEKIIEDIKPLSLQCTQKEEEERSVNKSLNEVTTEFLNCKEHYALLEDNINKEGRSVNDSFKERFNELNKSLDEVTTKLSEYQEKYNSLEDDINKDYTKSNQLRKQLENLK